MPKYSPSPSANRRQPLEEQYAQNERSQQQERQERPDRETSNQQQTQRNTRQSGGGSNAHEQRPEGSAEQPRRAPNSPAMRRYLNETDRWREFLVQDPNQAENMDRAFREWTKRCRDIFRRNGS